jgi:hypothetical protein
VALRSRLLANLFFVAIAGLCACTEPTTRTQLRVVVEADDALRDIAEEVSLVVEAQYTERGGGWEMLKAQRFEPRLSQWPLRLTIDSPRSSKVNYLVTATAVDDRESVVAEARALRIGQAFTGRTVFLRFEASCLRRALCPKGLTCHAGECVDATYDASDDPPNQSAPANAQDAGQDPGGPTVATEGEACAPAGARSCVGEGSRAPLECAEGMWRPTPMCAEDELCDMTPGAQRGTCRQIVNECVGQQPNIPFCDEAEMRVCVSSFTAETRPCKTNERCVAAPVAHCECAAGLVKTDAGCMKPTDCRVMNGGCDLLTTCTMRAAQRVCGDCPPGYSGTGETGCESLLGGLKPSAGELVPAFDPMVHSYRIKASLLTQRLSLTPAAPSAERLEVNGMVLGSGEEWTSPTLPLGEYPVKLMLTSKSGASSEYNLIIERAGTQTAYVKASNTGETDNFGVSVAMSGDTLVVGSFNEDSAAKTVDGDQTDNSLSNAGAAYVFVQKGSQWEQQAYLKVSDSAVSDHLGARVAIEGDTIVLGTFRSDGRTVESPNRPGAAYVFTRTAGKWTQTARLAGSDGSAADMFGSALRLSGDTIAIGAPRDGGDGSVYVFTRSGADWKQTAKLKPSPAVAGTDFGFSLDLSADTLIVGAPRDNRPLDQAGAAYIFVRNGADWPLQQRITADAPASGASFGYSVAVHGDRAFAGAPRAQSLADPLVTVTPGEVFEWKRAGGAWSQSQRLRATLPRSNDGFGSAIAASEGTLLIGACNDASGARGIGADASRRDAGYAGAAYLFALESDGWKQSAYLKASNAEAFDSFGFSAALSGDTAVLGANWEASKAVGINGNGDDDSANQSGAVYVFK